MQPKGEDSVMMTGDADGAGLDVNVVAVCVGHDSAEVLQMTLTKS